MPEPLGATSVHDPGSHENWKLLSDGLEPSDASRWAEDSPERGELDFVEPILGLDYWVIDCSHPE